MNKHIRMEGKLAAAIIRRKLAEGKQFRTSEGDELTNTIASLCWAFEEYDREQTQRDLEA
jgi:hypothetical protein